MKILSIVGARPQFIKAAMLCKVFEDRNSVDHQLIHTGQHFDDNMSRVFFDEMGIPEPLVNLGVNSSSHGAMTGNMLAGLEGVLMNRKPDMVVVYGDTDTTLAGALAAAKMGIHLSHVEAGLRSFNRSMPEEINRVVADSVSDLLFAPTPTAVENLKREGKPNDSIRFSGDIMFDAALAAVTGIDEAQLLDQHNLEKGKYILATLHRANNTDDKERLLTWLKGLNLLAKEETVLLPLHPRTRGAMENCERGPSDFEHIRFIDPVGYREMAVLTKNSNIVVTDSGGLQKEAYFHKVPCLILRNETEWVELLDVGWSKLIHCDITGLLDAVENFQVPNSWKGDLFGTGQTARLIAGELIKFL